MSVALLSLPVVAQVEETTVYTRVAHFGVPRAQWGEFTDFVETNVQPILEEMLADGTIVHWGNGAAAIHGPGGVTHGVWWAATSIAGIERVHQELTKRLPPSPATAEAEHHDHLLQSIIHRGKPTGLTSGYIYVSSIKVRPGAGQEWRQLWEKYFKATYDELLANGTILIYEVSTQYVHTEAPRWRYVWYIASSAEAEDKVNAAFESIFEREGLAIGTSFATVAKRSEHRDSFWQVINYAHK